MTYIRSRTALLAILGAAILAGNSADGSLAQDKPPSRTVEAPTTTGQAPREPQAPVGHRQPTANEVPADVNQPETNRANQEIDRRLNICRGC